MTETPLDTLNLTDQNTGRQVAWVVEASSEHGPNVRSRYGWTHTYMVRRPAGRRAYAVDVELVGDVVVRHNSPRKMF